MNTTITAFQNYLQLEKNYSQHTIVAYLNDLETFQNFVNQEYGQLVLEEVNYSIIRSWIVQMVDSGRSNSTVNRKVQSLKAYFKFLLKIQLIKSSPLLKHKALKTNKKLQIPFSEKELNEVLNHVHYKGGYEGIRDKLIIDFFYTTGIRRTELINLKIHDVNQHSNTIKVLGKRNKERIIPIVPIIAKQISQYLQERLQVQITNQNDYFFLTLKGIKLSESFVYRLINYYFSNVSEKVKKSPHILRHTFATHMLNNGADLNSIKELLGHSSLASTQIYTHSSLGQLKDVYNNAHPRNKN